MPAKAQIFSPWLLAPGTSQTNIPKVSTLAPYGLSFVLHNCFFIHICEQCLRLSITVHSYCLHHSTNATLDLSRNLKMQFKIMISLAIIYSESACTIFDTIRSNINASKCLFMSLRHQRPSPNQQHWRSMIAVASQRAFEWLGAPHVFIRHIC